jgi:hypothetical protein
MTRRLAAHLVRLGADLHLAQDGTSGVIKGGQQVPARFGGTG